MSKESTMSISKSLWAEWKGKDGSQLLSLMLKSLAITSTLWMLASVFLRYFKTVWDISE